MRVTDVLYEADRPMTERRARALAVNEAVREPLSEHLDDQRTKRRLTAGVALAGVGLGVAAFVANAGLLVAGMLVVVGLAGGVGFLTVRNRDPDVTVTGVSKGYWTGHCIPDEDGVVVYDASASLDPTSFDLERLPDDRTVSAARQRLDEIGEFPVVMEPGTNVEEEFTSALEDVRAAIENTGRYTVEAPVVPTEGPASEGVEFFLRMADPQAEPVATDVAVSAEEAREDVKALAELERMADDEGETELEAVSRTSQQLVSDLSGLQETAIDLLNDHIGTASDAFGLVSYNFYCPDCQLDDIDSRVALSDPQEMEWYCETCRTHHDTDSVIPRHRIKDDIVNPVWDQLWIEKDDQRREIYENIEDQKQDLQEREFEQRREEIRSASDRIKDLRSRIRDLKTEAKAAEGTVDEIGDLMVEYGRLNERRKAEFRSDVEATFAEIDRKTDEILERTRNEQQKRLEESEKAAAEKAELLREDERRREVEKLLAEKDLEEGLTRAEMSQRSAQHEAEMEMDKRQHREDWMWKTRGRTHISSHIGRAKMWKDRIWRSPAREEGER